MSDEGLETAKHRILVDVEPRREDVVLMSSTYEVLLASMLASRHAMRTAHLPLPCIWYPRTGTRGIGKICMSVISNIIDLWRRGTTETQHEQNLFNIRSKVTLNDAGGAVRNPLPKYIHPSETTIQSLYSAASNAPVPTSSVT